MKKLLMYDHKKRIYFFICSLLALINLLSSSEVDSAANDKSLNYNLVNGLPDIFLHPNSEKIGRTWLNGEVYDKPLINLFYSLLPSDEFFVVLDVGAQTGSFALLAKFFPCSKWHAFEPIHEAVDILEANLKLNDIQNVVVNRCAVGDFSGLVTLKMPVMDHWGLSTIGRNPLRFIAAIERTINCIDLDSYIEAEKIKKVHFIKMDTEGSELSILRGAKQMIVRDHPIILMEYNTTNMMQCDVIPDEVDTFLKEVGYTWELVSHEDILCIPE